MAMAYRQTLDFLLSRLPMFTRDGLSAYKADLTNILRLCQLLNNPQRHFKSIHVAGTNGKGSTSHMLAAILQTAGYKTGLYTSPHLRDFRERIRINGKMISKADVVNFTEPLLPVIEEVSPSFFEITVAMAFDYFAKQKTDVAVIEVGLGGRLDSTNIITPVLSLITNIGYDHVNILGHALEGIAAEKAGIIKPGIPVIIGQRQAEVETVFTGKAAESGSDIRFASDEWHIEPLGSATPERMSVKAVRLDTGGKPYAEKWLDADLTGTYQQKNLPGVLSAVEELQKQGFAISDEHIHKALSQVKKLTGLTGRWQTLGHDPLIICDTGHNEDGIREVLQSIKNTPHRHLHMVIGMVKDKDIRTILAMLPGQARYYFCQPRIPRAKAVEELVMEAEQAGLSGTGYSTVNEALAAAKAQANEQDLIFIGGSTFVVAEVV